jgi:hypothetical protein
LNLKPEGIADGVGEKVRGRCQPRAVDVPNVDPPPCAVHQEIWLLQPNLIESCARLEDRAGVEQNRRFTARVTPTEFRGEHGPVGEAKNAQPLQVQSPGQQRVAGIQPAQFLQDKPKVLDPIDKL